MKILLHICCANCLDQTLNGLRMEFGDNVGITGFFYNPNIHPLLEFRKRLKAVKVINQALKLPLIYDEDYGLDLFMRQVWNGDRSDRCGHCYAQRLGETARKAGEAGFDFFTSTLCVSKQQSHEQIRQAGILAAGKYGVKFLYRDLRTFVESTPRRNGIYSQQYCGCVFSEEERYRNTGKELYRGP